LRRPASTVRRTQQERREATISKLLDATIASLLAVGYTRTTAREICRRAKVSQGALFRFFPSVLAMVLAAGEEVARRQINEFEARFARMAGAADPVALALALLRDTCRSKSNTVFYELLVAARTDRALRRALEPAMRRYYDAIRRTAFHLPVMDNVPPDVRDVLLFTAIHVFDGESLARVVLPQPDLEERRIGLLLALMRLVVSSSAT
jgi:AcrR family transcriptional regulator